MRYTVLHEGTPMGCVDLSAGELVAGPLTPMPTFDVFEAPDGGVVVLACFRHAHASIPAVRHLVPRGDKDAGWPSVEEADA